MWLLLNTFQKILLPFCLWNQQGYAVSYSKIIYLLVKIWWSYLPSCFMSFAVIHFSWHCLKYLMNKIHISQLSWSPHLALDWLWFTVCPCSWVSGRFKGELNSINFEYIETNVENGIVDCLKNRHVIKRNHEEYTAV